MEPSAEGVFYIICNGTGVIPFLDFFDYLLRKTLYTILRYNCGKGVADRMQADEEYDSSLQRIQVILIGAFQSSS